MGRLVTISICLFVLQGSTAYGQCPASESGPFGVLAEALDQVDAHWWAGRPLSEARNAHRTNTKEEFEAAMDGDYNWFEGDVRREINHRDRVEMRHDEIHESGDNLTLREWLTMGRDSGKGLKLDVKETAVMETLLDTIEDVGVPEERLMLNLGDSGMHRWGEEIRRRFPDAMLAINPAKKLGEKENDGGPIQDWQVDPMIEHARRFGAPVTFVLHEGQVTRAAVERLQAYGPVSVWGNVSDPGERARQLRDEAGVKGMVDLGEKHGIGPRDAAEHVINRARTLWDERF